MPAKLQHSPARVGYGNLVKGSAFIVLRNLHLLLHLAALCFFLPCLLTPLFDKQATRAKNDVLFILAHVYLLLYVSALTKKDRSLALLINPHPDFAQHQAGDVVRKLGFVVLSILWAIQLKEATRMIAICQDFGIAALAVTMGGMMYAAHRLARGSTDGHLYGEQQKGRGRWGSRGVNWALNTVCASASVSGIAFVVLFCWSFLLTQDQRHELEVLELAARHSRDILVPLVLGASLVGMPAALLVCLLSTQASLYFSCNSLFSSNFAANDPLGRTSFTDQAASFHDMDAPLINNGEQ